VGVVLTLLALTTMAALTGDRSLLLRARRVAARPSSTLVVSNSLRLRGFESATGTAPRAAISTPTVTTVPADQDRPATGLFSLSA
jgi:hypothetical protein